MNHQAATSPLSRSNSELQAAYPEIERAPWRALSKFAAALAAFLSFVSLTVPLPAQEFHADLGEAIEYLLESDGGAGREALIPSDAPELARYPIGKQPPAELLDTIPGRPFHDVDAAPIRRHWWKYPVYAVVGLPRDGIDMIFGAASRVPVLNLPIVGLGYELIPLQALMRDPRDWHRWPGLANERGHGFIDAEGWGWFSNARMMEFTYEDTKLREKHAAENDALGEELHALNREIETQRREWSAKIKESTAAATGAIARGDGAEATARMLPIHLAMPTDPGATALVVGALATYGDSGPAWVRPYLWRVLSRAGQAELQQVEALLAPRFDARPSARTLGEALVFTRSRQGQAELAMLAAIAGSGTDPKDMRRARLAFEASLSARDADTAREAFAPVQLSAKNQAQVTTMELRLQILEGDAAKALEPARGLVASAPENPYYRYYLGVASLELVDEAEAPLEMLDAAVGNLDQAAASAPNWALRDRAARALSFARSLAEDPSQRKEKRRKGIFPE